MAALINAVEDERKACLRIDPAGTTIRHPPPPDQLAEYITDDEKLFQTIHMGAAVVDRQRWKLVIDGLVTQSLTLSLKELQQFPTSTVTSFHECYGPPTAPPVKALWRIGNVQWTGVPLKHLLDKVTPLPGANFIWSDGLDYGSFAGKHSDRYQKDLPLWKASRSEVLVAYLMNGEQLTKERGGPVRLVVPGWFGTNSTKWLCRLSLRAERAPSLFTTLWYNEKDPSDASGLSTRPVWTVEPNSMITRPRPNEVVFLSASSSSPTVAVLVEGWAWSCESIDTVDVDVSSDAGLTWSHDTAILDQRTDFSWQKFRCTLHLAVGDYSIVARATCKSGVRQPLKGRRNHVHTVRIQVVESAVG